ncbi:hypothetical protein [Burkholderia stagnalis]|nr:hypothetical protein [Burkholderia stagnalis]
MKRVLTHPLTKIFLGWLLLIAIGLMILPPDPPSVDQPTTASARPA